MAILVERVRIQNYKSIGRADVTLDDLTVLVGRNGAGKSNFIDAVAFVAEALSTTLEQAIRARGGMNEVRRRSSGHPTHFGIRLDLCLPDAVAGYGFRIASEKDGGFSVAREKARVQGQPLGTVEFETRRGELVFDADGTVRDVKRSSDHLLLQAVSGRPGFRELFDALTSFSAYNINPAVIREPQRHDQGDRLERHGVNITSVVRRLEREHPERWRRVLDYMRSLVPDLYTVGFKDLGPRETLEFRIREAAQNRNFQFFAANMSDGTLRALGVLVALFQNGRTSRGTSAPRLIAIEEPESTINPGSAALLMDALLEASATDQVLISTHSPDLLDHSELSADRIRHVWAEGGTTLIAPIDEASRTAVREELFTVGELLRAGQLEGDRRRLPASDRQLALFE